MTTATAANLKAIEEKTIAREDLAKLLEDVVDRVNEIHNLMEASRQARAPLDSIIKLKERLKQARLLRNQAGAALKAITESAS